MLRILSFMQIRFFRAYRTCVEDAHNTNYRRDHMNVDASYCKWKMCIT